MINGQYDYIDKDNALHVLKLKLQKEGYKLDSSESEEVVLRDFSTLFGEFDGKVDYTIDSFEVKVIGTPVKGHYGEHTYNIEKI